MNKNEGHVSAHPGSASAVTFAFQESAQLPFPPFSAPALSFSAHPEEMECACGPGFMSSQALRHMQGLFWCERKMLRGASSAVRWEPCLGRLSAEWDHVHRPAGSQGQDLRVLPSWMTECLCPGTPGGEDQGEWPVGSVSQPEVPSTVWVLSTLGVLAGDLARVHRKKL